MSRILLSVMLLASVLQADRATAAGSPGKIVLAHDDGIADTQRSLANTGHVVLFERPGDEFIATAVRIRGKRYAGDWDFDPEFVLARVSLCDADLQVLAQSFEPYASWRVGAFDWIEVPLGPARVPERFYIVVEFFPTKTGGVYLSIDDDAEGHGFEGRPGELSKPLEGGEWMIRVVGSKRDIDVEQANLETEEWIAHGEDEPAGKQSTAGTGHATLFKTVGRKRLVTGVSLCGQRYGRGRQPADSTFFHVFICDRKLKVLARFARPYSMFPTEELTWVDIDLPSVAVPKDFAILVYFDPTETGGVYLGHWGVKKSSSLSGLPGRAGKKLDKHEGWMIRARLAGTAGKGSLPPLAVPQADAGPDALLIAEMLADLEATEVVEDLQRANAIAAHLTRVAPEQEAAGTRFHESEHFFLRERGLPERAVSSLLELYEAAHTVLFERFHVERVGAHAGKKIHLRVTIDDALDTALFTDLGSQEFSRIVWRGPQSTLDPPVRGGPHVVYGLLHELGHVLMGWEDSRHQWAHYLGSVVTSLVHEELGDKGWFRPYDYHAVEGLPRFLRDIEGVDSGRDTDAGVARLFYAVQESFGMDVLGRACVWIRENRPGQPFEAVRLYTLDDLRDALFELGQDVERVRELFGN
ncbi:MAG: hypothetical protein V3T22_02730 [Planctomycetota bacterium]